MKKVFVFILLVVLLCGCQSKKTLQKDLQKAANIYYTKYVKGQVKDLDTLEVSLGDLRELKDKEIDLTEFKKCSDDTKITALIKGRKIVEYEISLKCN